MNWMDKTNMGDVQCWIDGWQERGTWKDIKEGGWDKEGWDVYIAAVYEVTLSPIDFYSSATVNHRCKSLSAGL